MDDAILQLEKAAVERMHRGDTYGFVEICDDEILYVDPNLVEPITDIEQFTNYMSGYESEYYQERSEFVDPRIESVGNAAVLSYNYIATVLAEDGSEIRNTPWNATEVYFRRYGDWKIAHTHWSFRQHRLPEGVDVPIPMQLTPQKYEGLLGELMALESAAMERWRKGDPGGFLDLYAPEVTYFDTGTPQRLNGIETMKAEYKKREGKIFYDVMDFIDPRVLVCGDMAVLFYRFLSTWLNPDGSISHRTPWNCTEVYVRRAERWKILHNHWSFIHGEQIQAP